jgi:hypothetical protein
MWRGVERSSPLHHKNEVNNYVTRRFATASKASSQLGSKEAKTVFEKSWKK